jgi:hypothetical protein
MCMIATPSLPFYQLFIIVKCISHLLTSALPSIHAYVPNNPDKETCSIVGRCRYISRLRAVAVAPYICIRLHISTPEISERFISILFFPLLKKHAFF